MFVDHVEGSYVAVAEFEFRNDLGSVSYAHTAL